MNQKQLLQEYLDRYLMVDESPFMGKMRSCFSKEAKATSSIAMDYECCEAANINTFIDNNIEEDTFQTKLFHYIDEKNLKDSDVYNKVNIDRRLFSKIRSDKNYHPSKETIILLGLALELKEQEIEDLLRSASYSLPMNNVYDLIIRFCFKEGIYNLFTINEFLEDHHCKLLNG